METKGMQLWRRALAATDEYLLRHLPAKLVRSTRLLLARAQGAAIGRCVTLGSGVHLVGLAGLVVRDGASIARDVTLDGRGGLTLGRDCLIGFESVILTSTHNHSRLGEPIQSQGMFKAAVDIGERVWLGARVIVQPGVTIGDDCIVGSGSVVTKSLASGYIYAGVPARQIAVRK